MEVTEAIQKGWGDFAALAERQYDDAILERGHFRRGKTRPTREQMRQYLSRNQLSARPYYGTEVEAEWAGFVFDAAEAKLAKLSKDGFSKFQENWLVVYDNLGLSSAPPAAELLESTLVEVWTKSPTFSAIFVVTARGLLRMSATTVDQIELIDLWSK